MHKGFQTEKEYQKSSNNNLIKHLSKMKRFVLISILTVFTVCLAFVSTCCTNPKSREPKDVETVITDTIVELSPEDATKEMLQIRESLVYEHETDSVFRNMPREIIIRIMMNNPKWGIHELVDEFILHKDRYIEDKTDYEKINDFEKTNMPDSIPIKAKQCVSTEHPVPLT